MTCSRFAIALLIGCLACLGSLQAVAADKEQRCVFEHVQGFLGKVKIPSFRRGIEQQPTIPAPFQAQGKANVARETGTETYLRGVRDQLLKSSPKPAPSVVPKIFLTSDRAYRADVMIDRNIMISAGLVRVAETDDEIAFLLAHELAHVLLGHMDDQRTLERSMGQLDVVRRGVDYASQLGQMSIDTAAASGEEQDAAAKAKAAELNEEVDEHNRRVAEFVDELTDALSNVAKPVWTSAQEDEADLFGMELMLRAGYSPAGAATALGRMQESQKSACAELMAFVAELDGYREKAETFDWVGLIEQQQAGFDWGAAIRPIRTSAEDKLRKAVLAAALPQTHRPWDKRKALIAAHLKTEDLSALIKAARSGARPPRGLSAVKQSSSFRRYMESSEAIRDVRSALVANEIALAEGAIGRVDMSTSEGRMLKRRLRRAQKRDADAVENIRLALNARTPSLPVFHQYAAVLLAEERYAEALELVERGAKQYSDDWHFLPEQIYVGVSREKPVEADAGQNRCMGVARRDIWDVCKAARTGLSAQFREQAPAILEAAKCSGDDCQGRFRLPWQWIPRPKGI